MVQTKFTLITFIFFLHSFCAMGQEASAMDEFKGSISQLDTTTLSFSKKRILIASGTTTGFYAGTLLALNNAWYKDFERTSFHTFNDSREWLQVDKIGHAWSAYNLAKYSTAMWDWTGISHKKASLMGGLSSVGYLTIIEYLDSHSSKWGWSWADMGANLIGPAFYFSQEMLWEDQRIQFKFSSHKASYDPVLQERVNDLFGKSFIERVLKDYNAQTYWLSANLKSFMPKSGIPEWLNVAVGYGSDGLLGGFENKWTDKNGNTIIRFDIPRKRQFYFSPDIDFRKIKTTKKGVRVILNLLNVLKMPAPTLMLDSKGKTRAYLVFF